MVTSSLPTLLTQFQSRYPLGCLLTELLTIHQGQFVVRVLVQSAGATIATAMAAAAEIETAEDRAKLRALEAIGIAPSFGFNATHAATSSVLPNPEPNSKPNTNQPSSKSTFPQLAAELSAPAVPSPPESELSLQSSATPIATKSTSQLADPTELSYPPSATSKPAKLTSSSVESSSLNSLTFDADLPPLTKSTAQATVQSTAASPAFAAADFSDFSTESSTVEAEPPVAVPAATGRTKSEKSPKRKAEASEPVTAIHPTTNPPVNVQVNPPANPADRSEEIMKIGIEMKRLGWSTEQGREYLKRTYGKRSRQELDDAELLDFLHYLETQPSPLQTPF